MKSILIIFIPLFLIGCGSNNVQKVQFELVSCPQVLFSKEHKTYITTEDQILTYDNISYRAEINNYNFDSECKISNNIFSTKLSFLFIVNTENATQSNILLPYFIAFLDDQKNTIDLQYYNVLANFNKNIETSEYIETEIIDVTNINVSYQNINTEINTILIGFMLDNRKLKILN